MSKQHMHAIALEEDLIFDYNWNSLGYSSRNKEEFPKAIEKLLSVNVDGLKGYKFPIGFIHRMWDSESSHLYSLSEVKTAIPADMYKHIQSVIDFLGMYGFHTSISDVLRFMIWVNFPYSIAPNGDLMTGEQGWLPPVVWFFEEWDTNLRFDRKQSQFCEPIGMKHCDRIYDNILISKLENQSVTNVFTNGSWKPEVIHELLILPNGEEFRYLSIQVLKEVESGKVEEQAAKSN